MPDVADDPSSATLTAWLVAESGDFVGAQSIATVETASSLLSIEVAEPGVLVRSLVEPGQPVRPGSALAVLAAPGEVIGDIEQLMVQLGLAIAPEAQVAGAHLRTVAADDPLLATTWPPHEPEDPSPRADELWAKALVEAASSAPAASRAEAADETVVVRRVVGWADAVADAVVGAVRGVDPGENDAAAVATRAKHSSPSTPVVRQVRLREEIRADELASIVSKVDGVSFLGLVVKAVAMTSRQAPLSPSAPSIADIAVQRWTRNGVVAPVVHVAGLMTASALSATLADLDARARAGRLPSTELESASVTVVDLGTEGIAEGHVDATARQPAVLMLGTVRVQPVVDGGRVVAGRTMTLALACDADQVSAPVAARWLAHLAGLLEQPLQFLT
jgi:pyruvate dehydrogenase E2 component (dihydrolipoamide acetyltransferase)